tara:strand:- start:1338 stop:2027 length:690 start_codon:yes stop_codon:yes gene_type:complete
MTQKFTIIFDLDGTLIDTAPDLMNAHNFVMKKFGYETKTTNDIRKLVGKGAGSLIGRSVWGQAKKEFGKVNDDQTKKEMTKEFIKYYANNIAEESKLINGALDFLNWCKKKNIAMGICTNKQDYLAVDLLKKINVYDYFEYVAGSNTFDYCKPDPRHLTNVIDIMQGDIKKTLMIGDSETDSDTARNASIPFILLEDGYTEKKVSDISHDHLVKDFIGIEKIISSYLNG